MIKIFSLLFDQLIDAYSIFSFPRENEIIKKYWWMSDYTSFLHQEFLSST